MSAQGDPFQLCNLNQPSLKCFHLADVCQFTSKNIPELPYWVPLNRTEVSQQASPNPQTTPGSLCSTRRVNASGTSMGPWQTVLETCFTSPPSVGLFTSTQPCFHHFSAYPSLFTSFPQMTSLYFPLSLSLLTCPSVSQGSSASTQTYILRLTLHSNISSQFINEKMHWKMWLAAKFHISKKLLNTYSVNIFYQIIKPMCVCNKPDRYIKEKRTLSPNLMPLPQGKEY